MWNFLNKMSGVGLFGLGLENAKSVDEGTLVHKTTLGLLG